MQNETWISLDYGQLEVTRTHLNYRVGALVTRIAVGGQSVTGAACVRNVEVGNEGDTKLNLLTDAATQCREDSKDCFEGVCAKDRTGCLLGDDDDGNCVSFCDLTLCPRESRCIDEVGALGHCQCDGEEEEAMSKGRYCLDGRRRDFVCPRHWWGRPQCGPCNCDTARGFNETCHATTGECTCKDNHYFQVRHL